MRVDFDTLLCSIDFSEISHQVIRCGKDLSLKIGARLVVFHSVPTPVNRFQGASVFQETEDRRKVTRRVLEKIEGLMEPTGLEYTPVVAFGDPVAEVQRAAEAEGADLVISAMRGLSGIKRLLLGTVVEQMARTLSLPLLTVRSPRSPAGSSPGSGFHLRQIVVGCDLLHSTDPALLYARELAFRCGATLHLLHTIEAPLDVDEPGAPLGTYTHAQEAQQTRLRERLEALLPATDRSPRLVCADPKVGIPGEALSQYAGQVAADLIVVGVQPRGAIEKMLVGSTTETVLRHAPCPVMSVPGNRPAVIRGEVRGDVGIVRAPIFLEHRTAGGHPENRQRLEAIYAMMDRPEFQGRFIDIPPRVAEPGEICLIHTEEYFRQIAATEGQDYTQISADTHTSAHSFRAALTAAGGVFEAVSQIVSGELTSAFALIRPPGHHAERSRAMGYCLFNNAALGAAYARRVLGLERILLVDWDVHHGNGTQHAFEDEAGVLFFSVHQHPHFPGTGLFTESGRGKGEGYTVNLPLPKGYGDAEYAAIFETLLRPVALEFEPDLIIVSAGFDTHRSDPLGGMRMTPGGFAALTRSLLNVADICCGGRMLLCLEGGYHPKATAESVRAVLGEMTGATVSDPAGLARQARRRKLAYASSRYRHVQGQYWKSL